MGYAVCAMLCCLMLPSSLPSVCCLMRRAGSVGMLSVCLIVHPPLYCTDHRALFQPSSIVPMARTVCRRTALASPLLLPYVRDLRNSPDQ